jgi:hypothetical protein
MHNDDHDNFYQSNRREAFGTLVASGLTLALLTLAGYFTPSLLALVAR